MKKLKTMIVILTALHCPALFAAGAFDFEASPQENLKIFLDFNGSEALPQNLTGEFEYECQILEFSFSLETLKHIKGTTTVGLYQSGGVIRYDSGSNSPLFLGPGIETGSYSPRSSDGVFFYKFFENGFVFVGTDFSRAGDVNRMAFNECTKKELLLF